MNEPRAGPAAGRGRMAIFLAGVGACYAFFILSLAASGRAADLRWKEAHAEAFAPAQSA